MHRIQQHVIRKLMFTPTARYADIKPDEVEGNLFMYHLRQLIKQALVIKLDKGYKLSNAGRRYAETLSLASMQPRIQPKIVTLLVIRNKFGEYLLYERARVPYRGLVGFPYGKIHLGETIKEAAEREINEKTGLSAHLLHRGEVYLAIYEKKELISHMLCHVFSGVEPTGELVAKTEIGKCFWKRVEHPTSSRYMPGFNEIYELVKEPGPRFFAEVTCQVDGVKA